MTAIDPTTPQEAAARSTDLVVERLRDARRDLVEISNRTRLLNCRLDGARVVRIVGERSTELFRMLVVEGRSMQLVPRPSSPAAPAKEGSLAPDRPAPSPAGHPTGEESGQSEARAGGLAEGQDDAPRKDPAGAPSPPPAAEVGQPSLRSADPSAAAPAADVPVQRQDPPSGQLDEAPPGGTEEAIQTTPLAPEPAKSAARPAEDVEAPAAADAPVGHKPALGSASTSGGDSGDSGMAAVADAADGASATASLSLADERHTDDLDDPDAPPAPHQLDALLQTELPREALERRLLRMHYEARSHEEEQGANILFLALGLLEWTDREGRDQRRFAPLVLVPVTLERSRAGASFRIACNGDDIASNLSLAEKLRSELRIALPELPDDESADCAAYCSAVAEAVKDQPGWRVLPNEVVLGFFSFTKFLMYRDLDPAAWPEGRRLEAHPLVSSLLGGAVPEQPPPVCGDDDLVDEVLPPEELRHVVDADSSQAMAVADVVQARRSLVIHGPPGTGKSQTIANIVAGAASEGRRVLFLAEKRAALEVVKRRLDAVGLGPLCLELHSTKANRRAVLKELGDTLQIGRPRVPEAGAHLERLRDVQRRLNEQAARLHRRDPETGLSIHQVLGELVRLRLPGRRWHELVLEGAERWTAAEVHERREAVQGLAALLERIGPVARHLWRGAGLTAILPSELDRLPEAIGAAEARLAEVQSAAAVLEGAVGSAVTTLGDLGAATALAEHLQRMPRPSLLPLPAGPWRERFGEIEMLVAALREAQGLSAELKPLLAPGAESAEVAALRRDLAASGSSWLRFLSPRWRRARRALRALCQVEPPSKPAEQLALLDRILRLQEARRLVEAQQGLGQAAFGGLWSGVVTDAAAAGEVLEWARRGRERGLPPDFVARQLQASGRPWRELEVPALRSAFEGASEAVGGLARRLELDVGEAFGAESLDAVPLAELVTRLASWREAPRRLDEWIDCRERLVRLRALGLAPLVDAIVSGAIAPAEAAVQLEHARLEAVLRKLDPEHAVLRFDPSDHERLRATFAQLDRERIALARAEVALRHYERLPRPEDRLGQMALIRREIQKRARHLPLRRLLSQAGQAVQRIKPVFMMSPLSVAQFLEAGAGAETGVEFDLLVIDEASQVRPVEALGAVARLAPDGQLVVVGDERQLPPTSFFRAEIDEEADDEAPGDSVRDLESILGLALAAGLPSRMLRWHYRSEHHSLIAVSNREFYENRLHVVPSPRLRSPRVGLWFVHLPGATFDRGGSAVNRAEAAAVADAVIEHAATSPELSLGVGAFSIRQRDAIIDELERRRRERPELEPFFSEDGPSGGPGGEPFFVKNLENIQGDERDVIFISVGYGRTPQGQLALHFGPVSNEGGERRLNVLITRAKRRCVVFSSITDEDIDLSRATGLGPAALKSFLRYARTGLLDGTVQDAAAECGPFEAAVAQAVETCGWPVDRDVGVGGVRVDLAVRDHARAGEHLLGIECDGQRYASARSARDRERTWPSVLAARGWHVHRAWSCDWYRRGEEAVRQVVAAIEAARAAQSAPQADDTAETPAASATPSAEPAADEGHAATARPAAAAPSDATAFPGGIARENPRRAAAADAMLTGPYRPARVRVPARTPPQDVPPERLRDIVAAVIDAEGPMHEEALLRRLATLWNMRRAGRPATQAFHMGLELAILARLVQRDGAFLDRPEAVRRAAPRPPRSRNGVDWAGLKRPELLPPSELRDLLTALIGRHLGIGRDELVTEARRQLGYGSTSANLRELLEAQIDAVLLAGTAEQRGSGLFLAKDMD